MKRNRGTDSEGKKQLKKTLLMLLLMRLL